jgi:hypothetical protein
VSSLLALLAAGVAPILRAMHLVTPHVLDADQLAAVLDAHPPDAAAYAVTLFVFNLDIYPPDLDPPDLDPLDVRRALDARGAAELDAWRWERPISPKEIAAHRLDPERLR